MPENLADGKFIQAITSTLDSVIAPYEWAKPTKYLTRLTFEQRMDEFGCLRKSGDWPLQFNAGEFWWRLIYEGKRGSGNTITFQYDAPTNAFTVSGSKLDTPRQDFTTQDSGEAFERLERRIEQIPSEP
ncbi:MAG TPA: hypothetical protein VJI52_02310 [Candidatus Nanoarchaeia archaeon]|nr:hypothetical protein [Candidatus Nanoarchaeia archaeon]